MWSDHARCRSLANVPNGFFRWEGNALLGCRISWGSTIKCFDIGESRRNRYNRRIRFCAPPATRIIEAGEKSDNHVVYRRLLISPGFRIHSVWWTRWTQFFRDADMHSRTHAPAERNCVAVGIPRMYESRILTICEYRTVNVAIVSWSSL